MPEPTPAGIGRSATDFLTDLNKVTTASPQPGASPALHATSSIGGGANLSATTTASSTLRGRSNSALPKLSTSVSSHFHAPWKFASDSRNVSRHRTAQSAATAGGHMGHGRLLAHQPPLIHHSSSQLSKTLLRRPGALTPSAVTAVGGLEMPLVKAPSAIEQVMNPFKEERERQRAEARNKEIDTVFHRISDVASQATLKLDSVYYSILEKMAVLKSTLSGLQQIYDQAKGLSAQFQADTDAVQRDVQEQADSFDGFRDQTHQIQVLEDRIKVSKQKMETLSDRLEAARERVRNLENREAEVQKNISFQFRIAYGIVGMIAAFFLIVFILNSFSRPVAQLKSSLTSNNTASISTPKIIQTPLQSAEEPAPTVNVTEDIPFDDWDFLENLEWKDEKTPLSKPSPHTSADRTPEDEVCTSSGSSEDDPRLRLFDEL